jgi:DNA-binding NarL/FixJ family response regulator
MNKKRVVVADDHPVIHEAISQVLDDAIDFELVGSATSGAQVAPLVARTNPDIVLLDLHMPVVDGLHCLALLREKFPQVAVVVFSGADESDTIEQALNAGAVAYVAKSISLLDIPSVLRQALERNVYYTTPRVNTAALTQLRRQSDAERLKEETGLTSRELDILGAVARGLSNRLVGKQLFLSDQTVKFHLHKIYAKLGVANRTEAARLAHRFGLVGDVGELAAA